MTALSHQQSIRDESDRLMKWQRDPIQALRDGFDALTYEQQWDLENEEFFDPEIFREVQQETEAFDRFTRHHDVAQYRSDCADIRGRD